MGFSLLVCSSTTTTTTTTIYSTNCPTRVNPDTAYSIRYRQVTVAAGNTHTQGAEEPSVWLGALSERRPRSAGYPSPRRYLKDTGGGQGGPP